MSDASMEDLEDYMTLTRAANIINEAMKGEDKEFSIALMVAIRDWICDRYGDDNLGFEIALEVGKGKI